MCWLASTLSTGQTFGDLTVGRAGKFFWGLPDYIFTETALPTGVITSAGRVSSAGVASDAKSRMYLTGGWTDNIVFTELLDLCRMGIVPPTNQILGVSGSGNAVGFASGAGPGVTGNFIGRITWWDDRHQRRSGLSGPSPTLSLTNQTRVWSNLPPTCEDPTVTHIEGWVEANGNSPRFAWRRDLGTTSVTEAVATGTLGEAFTDDIFRFPRCRYNVAWHDRLFMAGDDRHPNRLYFSPLNDQENYSGTYLVTRKGERIIALVPIGDYLVVLCNTSSYVVTGYTEDDFKVDTLEPFIGGISHWANVNVDGWAIIPSQRGLYLCTGTSMYPISTEFQHTWRRELAANESGFRESWAVNDIDTNSYKLCVLGQPSVVSQYEISTDLSTYASPGFDDGCTYWTLDYTNLLKETGGGFGQPALSFDTHTNPQYCAALLRRPREPKGRLHTGAASGNIYRDTTTPGFTGTMAIVYGHDYFDEPGGTYDDAFTFERAWNFVAADVYTAHMYAGDEYAWQRKPYATEYADGNAVAKELFGISTPSEDDDLDDGIEAGLTPGDALDRRSVSVWGPETAGAGMTLIHAVANPNSLSIVNGYGGTRLPGVNQRGSTVDPESEGV